MGGIYLDAFLADHRGPLHLRADPCRRRVSRLAPRGAYDYENNTVPFADFHGRPPCHLGSDVSFHFGDSFTFGFGVSVVDMLDGILHAEIPRIFFRIDTQLNPEGRKWFARFLHGHPPLSDLGSGVRLDTLPGRSYRHCLNWIPSETLHEFSGTGPRRRNRRSAGFSRR